VNNQQTSSHHSLIFALRELSSSEIDRFCSNTAILDPPIIKEQIPFTSNYQLRIYTSACYYLDKTNQWKSDGMIVSTSLI